MKRSPNPVTGWYCTQVCVKNILDAIDWCDQHNSDGSYYVEWAVSEDTEHGITFESEIFGIFGFNLKEDHFLFALNWTDKILPK